MPSRFRHTLRASTTESGRNRDDGRDFGAGGPERKERWDFLAEGISAASSPEFREQSREMLESIAVCALLSCIDPRNDVSVAVRTYALTGMVEEAWTWLLEDVDLYTAVAEVELLMAMGTSPRRIWNMIHKFGKGRQRFRGASTTTD